MVKKVQQAYSKAYSWMVQLDSKSLQLVVQQGKSNLL
jgi:hypothetical protein